MHGSNRGVPLGARISRLGELMICAVCISLDMGILGS